MVAVLRLDVDANIAEGAGDCAQLARNILLEAADQHRADGCGAETRTFQRRPRRLAVLDQEMGMADAADRVTSDWAA